MVHFTIRISETKYVYIYIKKSFISSQNYICLTISSNDIHREKIEILWDNDDGLFQIIIKSFQPMHSAEKL